MSAPKISGAGDALRSLRESLGVSLGDLADRLGWDKGRLLDELVEQVASYQGE